MNICGQRAGLPSPPAVRTAAGQLSNTVPERPGKGLKGLGGTLTHFALTLALSGQEPFFTVLYTQHMDWGILGQTPLEPPAAARAWLCLSHH